MFLIILPTPVCLLQHLKSSKSDVWMSSIRFALKSENHRWKKRTETCQLLLIASAKKTWWTPRGWDITHGCMDVCSCAITKEARIFLRAGPTRMRWERESVNYDRWGPERGVGWWLERPLMTMTGYSRSHCAQRDLPPPVGVWTETVPGSRGPLLFHAY